MDETMTLRLRLMYLNEVNYPLISFLQCDLSIKCFFRSGWLMTHASKQRRIPKRWTVRKPTPGKLVLLNWYSTGPKENVKWHGMIKDQNILAERIKSTIFKNWINDWLCLINSQLLTNFYLPLHSYHWSFLSSFILWEKRKMALS